MKHPLDGARLKIVRAQKHLETLKDEIARYLSTNPYEFPTEYDGNTMSTREAVIKVGCESPEELSCILSECVNPLRSALDYIAWELATRYSSTTPIVGKDKGIFFPILDAATGDGAERFAKMAKKYAFPAAAISLIESVQPYQAGHESLGILNSLANRDKHCLPLLTIAYAETTSILVSVTGAPMGAVTIKAPGGVAEATGFDTGRMEIRQLGPDDFGPDGRPKPPDFAAIFKAAREAAAPGDSGEQPRSVKVDGQVTVFVSLNNAPVPFVPIERTVEQIVKCVTDIVPRFETFF